MDLVQTQNLSIRQESLRSATSRAKCRDDGTQNKMEKIYQSQTKANGMKKAGQDGEGGHLTLSNPGDTWLV